MIYHLHFLNLKRKETREKKAKREALRSINSIDKLIDKIMKEVKKNHDEDYIELSIDEKVYKAVKEPWFFQSTSKERNYFLSLLKEKGFEQDQIKVCKADFFSDDIGYTVRIDF